MALDLFSQLFEFNVELVLEILMVLVELVVLDGVGTQDRSPEWRDI